MAAAKATFDSFQSYYEIMVDWDARLEREAPLFQRVFQSVHAHCVLDCACGTGHHACLFARWGMEVAGSDISEEMIRKSEHLAATRKLPIRFRAASFDKLADVFDEEFDATVCVGNSLSLAKSRSVAAAGIRQMHEILRPGGALLIQVLNYEQFPPGEHVYGDPVHREHIGQNYLFLKSYHRAGTKCDMDIIVLTNSATDTWFKSIFAERLLVLDRAALVQMVEQAGFGKIKLYGGYEMTPFEPKTSRDLVVVARRESTR